MIDVVERLVAQAARLPNAIAVVEPAGPTTYAAFLDRVMAYAARLGQVEAPRVLIALEKGREAYAAMFGTLMAGGTYAPVNVSAPAARLRLVGESFEPHFIIAKSEELARSLHAAFIDPDSLASGGRIDAKAPAPIAYVIFTSGSTGEPKGVAIPRTALTHYVDWLGPAMAIGPGDRMSQHPNIGFDLSVLDIYGALCYGASLYPFVTPSARLLPARRVQDDALTIWNSVPSVISLMATAGELDAQHLRSVRLFTFCGEVLRADQVEMLFTARPDAIVFNTYGPTEATVAMTCRRLTAETYRSLCSPSAPLGSPIGAMALDLAGGGDEGEIVISGPQLAAGYWRDERLTAEKFRDVMRPEGPIRAFFTGDDAVRVGGELYFLSRRDDMVKVRGHRVHLGEIRNALHDMGWPSAFVFEKTGALLAVVERTKTLVFDEQKTLGELSRRLDGYFLPSAVLCIDRLPLTANDKLDVAALKAMFDEPPK